MTAKDRALIATLERITDSLQAIAESVETLSAIVRILGTRIELLEKSK